MSIRIVSNARGMFTRASSTVNNAINVAISAADMSNTVTSATHAPLPINPIVSIVESVNQRSTSVAFLLNPIVSLVAKRATNRASVHPRRERRNVEVILHSK